MTSVTLHLNDDLVERAKEAAKNEGISLEKKLALLVEEAMTSPYELDDDEAAAVAEGLADDKAGRMISHDEMMRRLDAQRGR
jgi:predicted transcriptional regulator